MTAVFLYSSDASTRRPVHLRLSRWRTFTARHQRRIR